MNDAKPLILQGFIGKMYSGQTTASTVADPNQINLMRGQMAATNISKFCPACKTHKPTEEFYNNKSKHDGLAAICKPCTRRSNKPSIDRGRLRPSKPICPEASRRYRLKTRFGISVDDYDALMRKQGGKCAICRTISERRLSVDHCHETKIVRGLLCAKCNSALGVFGDNASGMRKALDYLEPNRGWTATKAFGVKDELISESERAFGGLE